jgi:hypothetical protein
MSRKLLSLQYEFAARGALEARGNRAWIKRGQFLSFRFGNSHGGIQVIFYSNLLIFHIMEIIYEIE